MLEHSLVNIDVHEQECDLLDIILTCINVPDICHSHRVQRSLCLSDQLMLMGQANGLFPGALQAFVWNKCD